MKRFLGRLNIHSKLLLFSASTFLFAVILVCLSNYYISINKVSRDTLELSASLSMQRLANFENAVLELNRNIFDGYNGSPLPAYLKRANEKNKLSAFDETLLSLRIELALKDVIYRNNVIECILILDLEGGHYFAGKAEFTDYSLQLSSLNANSELLREMRGGCLWRTEDGRIFVERLIYNTSYIEPVGLFSAEINREKIALSNYIETASTYSALVDSQGEFFLASDAIHTDILKYALRTVEEGLGQDLRYDGMSYKVNVVTSANSRRRVIDILPLNKLTESWGVVIILNLAVGALILLIVVIIANYITRAFSNRIKRLLTRIDRISKGNFYEDVFLAGEDELSALGMCLNELGRNMDGLIKNSVREQQAREELQVKILESQYYAIQSQLNPHFIYNFLESVSSLATIKRQREISEIICEFANLLRSNVERREKYVTLAEETDYLKNYVDLYRRVYPQKLSAAFHIDELLGGALIPSFIMLPLVENVIVHQVEKSIRKIHLEVVCRKEGEEIILDVTDDGDGMDDEYLRGLMAEIDNFAQDSPADNKRHARVGLKSINRIIRLRYGENYGLHIESGLARGTTVRIRIPFSASPL